MLWNEWSVGIFSIYNYKNHCNILLCSPRAFNWNQNILSYSNKRMNIYVCFLLTLIQYSQVSNLIFTARKHVGYYHMYLHLRYVLQVDERKILCLQSNVRDRYISSLCRFFVLFRTCLRSPWKKKMLNILIKMSLIKWQNQNIKRMETTGIFLTWHFRM